MKCPYQKDSDGNFANCTTDCPACEYEIEKYKTLKGNKYPWQSKEKAIEEGTMWETTHERYIIKGCKYLDALVRPTNSNITKVNNVQKTNVAVVKNSIF